MKIRIGLLLTLAALSCVFIVNSLNLSATTSYSSYANDLEHYVAKLRNEIPKGKYIVPTAAQIELLRKAADHAIHASFATATQAANAAGYRLKSFSDKNGSTYYILESTNPSRRPWGSYIFYIATDGKNVAIEIPDPTIPNTSVVGIKVFKESKAKIFMLSGSSPKVCNVATQPNTVFQGIHEQLAYTEDTVIQLLGFRKRSYPDVVITSGTPIVISATDDLVNQLMLNGLTVGMYDGTQYPGLGATNNIQAIQTNTYGNDFIGIYVNRPTLSSSKRSTLLTNAIKEFINPSTDEDSDSETTNDDTTTT